jgi:hypothetical protein
MLMASNMYRLLVLCDAVRATLLRARVGAIPV